LALNVLGIEDVKWAAIAGIAEIAVIAVIGKQSQTLPLMTLINADGAGG
jgi:hypothetical protein